MLTHRLHALVMSLATHRSALVAIAVALSLVLWVVRQILCTGPYRLPRVLPWRVSRRPVLMWHTGPFLGWSRGILGQTRWAFGSREDTVAIVGPPRISGKTAGIVIPQAAMFDGALVTTSTKPDVLRHTAARRLELARQHGGDVYVYAPTATGPIEGFEPVRWSPLAGCEDPLVAAMRVDALVSVAEVGKNVENADHWRTGAARILRPYFLAAAHHSRQPGDFALVARWLSLHEFREPLSILSSLRVEGAQEWAADLAGVAERTNDRERSSFFAAAQAAVKATAVPRVLRSCSGTDIDPAAFINTRSTLYIISPSEYQTALAPLCAALVESIVVAAYRLHDAHRPAPAFDPARLAENVRRFVTGQEPIRQEEPPRTLLQLDELTNIAPVPTLESIVSQGAGRGVPICWTAQSLAQLRNRYGDHAADAIWSASTCKVVFGGLADVPTLDQVSRLIGDHRVPTRTVSLDNDGFTRRRTRGYEWRPRLAPSQLRELPRRWTVLLYHQRKPYAMRAPIAVRKRRLRRALRPVTVVRPARQQATALPTLTVVRDLPEQNTATGVDGGGEAER